MKPAELKQRERVVEPGAPLCPGRRDLEPAPHPSPRAEGEVAEAAARLLTDASADSICLQDFRPLAESLDWELGQAAWGRRGSRSFFADGVPYGATNNGWLSRNAADLLFTALAETEARAPLPDVLQVLELGAGLGLFARGFLSAFRDLCRARGADYYERLRYLVTDRSERMVDDLRRSGVLDGHPGRWQARRLDALCIGDALDGHDAAAPVFAAFANYVLDVLPATVLQIGDSGLRELCVATHLARGVDLAAHTDMPLEEILRRARSDSAAERATLADIQDLLVPSFRFLPTAADRVPYGAFVAGLVEPGQYVLHNHGALQCLEGLVPRLHPQGFVLAADYGQADSVGSDRPWQPQRFGSSLAMGVNFPLLAAWCGRELGCECIGPATDHPKLHCRLVGRGVGEGTAGRFRRLFNGEALAWEREPLARARACVQQGDSDGALRGFAEALRRQGASWALLDEIARFLTYSAADYARGLEMAALVLEINPVCPGPWTTYGDALYHLGRLAEARSAYERALCLNPESPRALLSLSYVHSAQGDYAAALRAVADGLSCDHDSSCQERLLRRQAAVLDSLGRRRQRRRKARAARAKGRAPAEADGDDRSRRDAR